MKINKLSEYQKYLLGIICKILALSCFCVLSLGFEKLKSNNHNSLAQFGIVCLIGTIILLFYIMLFHKKELMQANLKLYPIRAIFSIAGMVAWIEAVKYFGSSQSILVNYLTPIITITIASITKDEKLKLKCVFLGVVCYLVIYWTLKANIEVANYGFIMALISSFAFASYEIICKKQTLNEHPIIQAFYTFLFAGIFLIPVSYKYFTYFQTDTILLVGITLLRIANIILLFVAIKFVGLNLLAPVSYLKFPLMAFLGFLLLGKVPQISYLIATIILIIINIIVVKLVSKKTTNNFK